MASRAVIFMLTWLWLSPTGAQAQLDERPSDNASVAQSAGRQALEAGIQAYGEGRFEDALKNLEQADQLEHRPEIVFNLARVRESLGHVQEASTLYKSYLIETGTRGKFARDATSSLRRLEQANGTVVVRGPRGSSQIVLDGRVQTVQAPGAILASPGKHIVQVKGEQSRQAVVEVTAGKAIELDLGAPNALDPNTGGCAACSLALASSSVQRPSPLAWLLFAALASRRRRSRATLQSGAQPRTWRGLP